MLIGRRHVRSNNSWMHNYERLVKCHLYTEPTDRPTDGVPAGTGAAA